MKKFFACFLALILALGTLAGCGGKTESGKKNVEDYLLEQYPEDSEDWEMTPVDIETAREAIVETALAYYRKNPYGQYDARSLTTENPQKIAGRLTQYESPEYASSDQCYFAQCTQFTLDILHDTFGWHFFDDIKEPHTEMDQQWFKYEGGAVAYKEIRVSDQDMPAKLAEYRSLLVPGDIVVSWGPTSGHAMMFLGDCLGDGTRYLLHDWGSSIEYLDGYSDDSWEANGALFLQPEDELIFGPKVGSNPNWNLETHSSGYMEIFRFTDDENFKLELTPQAVSRLKYKRMTVDSYVEGIKKYNDITKDSEITLVTEITNNSTEEYKDVPVVINVPTEGAALVEGEKTEFTVNVPAGESVKCSCKLKVTANRGSVVSIPKGKVDNIPTRYMAFKVSGTQMTEEQKGVISDWAFSSPRGVEGTQTALVKSIYKTALGVELDIPDTVQEVMDALFDTKGGMLVKKDRDETNSELMRMTIRQHIGGHNVSMGRDIRQRVAEVHEEYYQVGDIFIATRKSGTTSAKAEENIFIYIYLGAGTVLEIHNGICSTDGFDETLGTILGAHMLVAIRPTLAVDDIASVAIPAK